MLPTRKLQGTEVVTSVLGFGCAGLFWIPQRSRRRLVLDAIYDAGIRHFDVAPMYGLGLAEAELAQFLRRRRPDVTVTTKFGITPTPLARGVAVLQGPLRTLLTKQPKVKARVKDSGQGPRSGTFGRLLYSSPGYTQKSAQLALERSLRSLKTDWIDVFLLHDPVGRLTEAPELVGYLEDQRRQGRIRSWGLTGGVHDLPEAAKCLARASVIQYRDDIFEGPQPIGADLLRGGSSITYGTLARALPILHQFLVRSPSALDTWSAALEEDLTKESTLPQMLLRMALRRNTTGPVLFTTTQPDRGYAASEAIRSGTLTDAQAAVLNDLACVARILFQR